MIIRLREQLAFIALSKTLLCIGAKASVNTCFDLQGNTAVLLQKPGYSELNAVTTLNHLFSLLMCHYPVYCCVRGAEPLRGTSARGLLKESQCSGYNEH